MSVLLILCMFLGFTIGIGKPARGASLGKTDSPSQQLLFACSSSSRGGALGDFLYLGCQLLVELFWSCLGSHVVEIRDRLLPCRGSVSQSYSRSPGSSVSYSLCTPSPLMCPESWVQELCRRCITWADCPVSCSLHFDYGFL